MLRREGSSNQAVDPNHVEMIHDNPFAMSVMNYVFHSLPYMMLHTNDCGSEPAEFN
jgi:hypothetical protein